MTITAIQNSISKIKNGSFVSVEYETVPSILASAKKCGISITKRTSKVVRLGVNYFNIKRVIEKKLSEGVSVLPSARKNPYEWVLKNKIARNIDNNNLYVQIANIPGHSNTKSRWFLNSEEVGFEEVKDYITPSYLNRSDAPTIQKINIDNIIRIG